MSVLFLSAVHRMLSQTSYLSFRNISFPFYKKGLLICPHKVDLGNNKQVNVPREYLPEEILISFEILFHPCVKS